MKVVAALPVFLFLTIGVCAQTLSREQMREDLRLLDKKLMDSAQKTLPRSQTLRRT